MCLDTTMSLDIALSTRGLIEVIKKIDTWVLYTVIYAWVHGIGLRL